MLSNLLLKFDYGLPTTELCLVFENKIKLIFREKIVVVKFEAGCF
jgi:hypothetical protein